MIQAVFIDRDGTIGGSDQVEYPGEFELFSHAQESIKVLKMNGKKVYSFTNQPGVSKRVVTKDMFVRELTGYGFDQVYLCPHQHEQMCDCRKPNIGLLVQATKDHNLDLEHCVVIGDRWTDLLAAHRAGCKKVLVQTGAGKEAFHQFQKGDYFGEWADVEPDYVAKDLKSAVEWVLSD
ncbi:HAD-IIIA family hydrolase [Ornithinibacillus sp. L9]|uniref:D,D-heptose 1,7-bisphosphate phosphatase n=1 Tax=Ornithinibacillus caprae TaxID=2678566 RepID=A0A6N8FGW7_9BACI|nr:HAD-IIIA family hydrolase [Ornithinibacillus caprae]MUK88902.1 HAD-IIIA family hydrolase [Ornithinibacillus caprae]